MNWKFWKQGAQNATLKEAEWWRQTFGGKATMSGATVTDSTSLQQSAVYRAIGILATTVASLPLRVYEADGETRKAVDHPLNRLLGVTPNGEQTAFELREFQMICLGLRGNAYAQKRYSQAGRIGEINPLNAALMNVDRDSNSKLVFDYQETGNAKQFTADEIWRISGFAHNGVTGLSPISLARESIGTSIAIEGHASSAFKNGINPSMVLSHPSAMTDEAYRRLKDQLDSNNAGFGNNGKPMLVEGGMAASVVGMSHADAQFIESRKFQIEEIARWYGVPPHMLGLLDRATFSNIEQQSIDFVVNTIRPWLSRIESTMMRDLLSPSEQGRYFLSHTVEGLLRGDTQTRYAAYGSGIDKGWLSRNEVRLMENRQPIDGLDELVLPVNVETISEREQRFEGAVVSMLADQEINALRAERNKKGDDFGDRVVDFYARFNAKLIEFGASKEDAQAYTVERCKQVECGQFDKIERTAQTQIGRIL